MCALSMKHFLLLETIVLALANTQAVRLAHSENAANNFTTYQLKVPGSDPITIYEDVTESGIAMEREAGKIITRRNGDHLTDKELVPLTPPGQQRLNNRNQDVRATLSFQVSDSENTNDDDSRDSVDKKRAYSHSLLKKFIKDYSEKIKNADESTKNALKEIEKMNQKHSNNEEEVTTTDRVDFEDEKEQKYNKWNDRYTHKYQTQTNPFNDRDGWVTLEAVPWSSSKVSKWYPHNNKFSHKNSYDSPLSHQPSYEEDDDKYYQTYQSSRPSTSLYNDEFSDDYVDDHPTSKPIYTSYDPYKQPLTNNRPQNAWSQNQNTGYEKRPTHKPRPRPQYDYGHSNPNNQHQSYDDERFEANEHYYDIDRNTPKPWSQDIITDNRPSDFPIRVPSKRPHSSDREPTRYRPFSHPENGNGEWVLVSTTKGYQAPNRQGQRAMAFSNNRPNDLTSHHSVKLTVLPSKNDTFSSNGKPSTLSHGGLLEVESSFQSVEDSAALAGSVKKPNVRRRKVFRGVPMQKGIAESDGSAVLAAVGAGMVPATMAMLMPMVLGRRKRSAYSSYVPNGSLVLTDFK